MYTKILQKILDLYFFLLTEVNKENYFLNLFSNASIKLKDIKTCFFFFSLFYIFKQANEPSDGNAVAVAVADVANLLGLFLIT